MVFGIRKSNSLPILCNILSSKEDDDDDEDDNNNHADDDELVNNNHKVDINRLSTALVKNNHNKIDSNCKHYSLRRNDNNKLKINTQVLCENKIKNKNANSKSKIDHIKSLLSPRVNTHKTTKSNQTNLSELNNNFSKETINTNRKKSSDPVNKINNLNSLKKVLKEPVSRVIKITEIIEIDNNDDDFANTSKKLTKHELLNKYCFASSNSKTALNYIDMMTPESSTSPDSDEPTGEKHPNSTTTKANITTNINNTNEMKTKGELTLNNNTFIKSPPVCRKIELNQNLNRKPHQIYSTTQVKSTDLYDTSNNNSNAHMIKIEREDSKNHNKLGGNILQEIMKLTNESLNNLDLNKKQAQQTLTRQQSKLTEPISAIIDDKTIPVVHNFSFVNNDNASNDSKPKRITIKITGRTRSVSTDKNNLIKKANLGLGTYRLDELLTQDKNQGSIEFKLNDKLIEPATTACSYNTNTSRNIPIHTITNNESNKFNLDKFKSYFTNNTNNTNRSFSLPPNEREQVKDDSIYGFVSQTPTRNPNRKLDQSNEVWMETFKPEPPDLKMLDEYSDKPFQTNQHLSLIKNAGDILNSNNSAFSCINKLDVYSQKVSPVWAYRETEDSRSNSANVNNNCKKPANLSTLNTKNRNINGQFDDRFDLSELDYSPSFYSSEANSMIEFNQNKTRPSRLVNGEFKSNKIHKYFISNNNNEEKQQYEYEDNNDEKFSTLPANNRSMKKVASYYNDYYKDRNLFINRNRNFSKSYEMSPSNLNKMCAKYIDDEDYDEDDDDDDEVTSDDLTETNSSLYSNRKLTYLDETVKSASFRVNNTVTNSIKSNEKRSNLLSSNHYETNSTETTPRTPKLSRRVIFADELN